MTSLNTTLGVLEIGILLSGVLFGVVTSQVYIYHKNFPKDSLWLQIGLIDGLWLLELGHTICICHAIYFYTVTNYGHSEALRVAPISLALAVILHGITVIFVQAYFTYRIYRFSHKPYLIPIISIILMFTQLVSITTLSAEAIIVAQTSLSFYLEKWQWLVMTTISLRVAADLTISSSLVYSLYQQRTNAYESTVLIVDQLIRWTIETGVVTSMLGIAIVIAYLTAKENYTWLALFMVLPKVFSNTLLANVNSRAHLRNNQSNFEVSGSSGLILNRSGTLATGLAVTVHTQMETFDDSPGGGNCSVNSTDKYDSV
ncbi:hypothetical protein F5878DRAFT_80725 [Lentinula raphanica]|uniref:DUF6534 domain-containing protein n=1 Tax=Lentinula raphanica TaxID=153919 RepID=A0AA38PC70_9AGAR|nr:hypothetical protein F5880DRAFT_267483 [Lentinula raphanica]KAJ3840215.1 hypothetical protein F5878DRAFT_80725 [Lentinula raphanica]